MWENKTEALLVTNTKGLEMGLRPRSVDIYPMLGSSYLRIRDLELVGNPEVIWSDLILQMRKWRLRVEVT